MFVCLYLQNCCILAFFLDKSGDQASGKGEKKKKQEEVTKQTEQELVSSTALDNLLKFG